MSAEFPVNPDSLTLSERYPNEMLPVKVISLTQNQYAIIDPEDYELVSQHKWQATKPSKIWYAVTWIPTSETTYEWSRGVLYTRTKRKNLRMHFLITNFPRVDHVNRIGTDNRRMNLRPSTVAENRINSIKGNGRSCYKGVFPHNDDRQYRAKLGSIYLGSFDNEIDAAKAYDNAARKHFGSYARLNFPRGGESATLYKNQNPVFRQGNGSTIPGNMRWLKPQAIKDVIP